MFELQPLTTENIIDCVGILCTIITIVLSIKGAKKTLKEAILQQKEENSLKRIDEIPSLLDKNLNSIITLTQRSFGGNDKYTRKEAANEYDKNYFEMRKILIAYGSKESIKIFCELRRLLYLVKDNNELRKSDLIEIYAIMVLLYVQIRYDLNEEFIELNYFVELLLPGLEKEDEIYDSIKKYADKFGVNIV